jgi:hypothetical protein
MLSQPLGVIIMLYPSSQRRLNVKRESRWTDGLKFGTPNTARGLHLEYGGTNWITESQFQLEAAEGKIAALESAWKWMESSCNINWHMRRK